jgi:POLQ-like helicase
MYSLAEKLEQDEKSKENLSNSHDTSFLSQESSSSLNKTSLNIESIQLEVPKTSTTSFTQEKENSSIKQDIENIKKISLVAVSGSNSNSRKVNPVSFDINSFFTQNDTFNNMNLTQLKCNVNLYDGEKYRVIENSEIASQYLRRKENEENICLSRSYVLPEMSMSMKIPRPGPFFGLTLSHKKFLLETKKIDDLYDWQKECLSLRAIQERTNLIYALPTSGGKTLVAEIAMFREVLLRKKNVIFILPFVSIVQEKVQDLMPFAVEYNFLVEEYCAGKGQIPPVKRTKRHAIYICTIEKGSILLDSLYGLNRQNEIGLVVVDELHSLGDDQRGYVLESFLTKVVQMPLIQVIGMSATISNLTEVASFLKADIYTRDFRPVELTEYAKIGCDIFSIDSNANSVKDAFKKVRSCGAKYDQNMSRCDPDHLVELVVEIVPKNSCLVFCATKKNCENVAILLANNLPLELKNYKCTQKKSLIESMKADSNGQMCKILAQTLPFGVAYHHSGLTRDERKRIEDAYRNGLIQIICCTSTLAAGVNLPAKRVIIRSPHVGKSFLTLTKYKQMVGRAGRAGKCDAGDSIVICSPKDFENLTNLLCSQMDETISGYITNSNYKYLKTSILNLIGMTKANSIDNLIDHFKNSLLNVQINRTGCKLRGIITKCVEDLVNDEAISFKSISIGFRNVAFKTADNVEVFPDDHLEVSKLGKASANAGIDLDTALKIENDLKIASKNLDVSHHLHLFYVIAPDDIVNSIYPDYNSCDRIMSKLDPKLMKTLNLIGFEENVLYKMITKSHLLTPSQQILIKRIYVALMMLDLWKGMEIHNVSIKYGVGRGIVCSLMTSSATKAYTIFKFCEVIDEFWAFRDLMENLSKRLNHCCSNELFPLMELPFVKKVS